MFFCLEQCCNRANIPFAYKNSLVKHNNIFHPVKQEVSTYTLLGYVLLTSNIFLLPKCMLLTPLINIINFRRPKPFLLYHVNRALKTEPILTRHIKHK